MSIYTKSDRQKAAVDWIERGAALVPVRRDTKYIVKGWGPRQRTVTDVVTAVEVFSQGDYNLGVVTGGEVGLACADFDTVASYGAWRSGPGLGARGLIERTRRGFHVWFIGYHGKALAGEGWEFKAGGAVCLVAPSTVAGYTYGLLVDDSPLAWTPNARDSFSLLSGIEKTFSAPLPVRVLPRATGGGDVVSKIKAAVPVLELARSLVPSLAGEGRWLHGVCPFHKDAHPSFYVDTEKNTWGCLSANCAQRGTHDVINLAALVRGVDNRTAIKQLAAEVLA